MPTTIGEQNRNWWSLPKSPSGRDLRQDYSQEKRMRRPPQTVKTSGLNFNSFASAIGFKSKKHHPSLAIQEPPSPLGVPLSDPSSPLSDISRAPSKTASSTRSRVDSIEPRTPVDGVKRGSLLTLSDTDPFAGRPIIAPHIPTDPNRLSAYSNPSVTEILPNKNDTRITDRVSYASSTSNNYGTEITTVGVVIPSKGALEVKRLHTKRSTGSLQVMRPDPHSRQTSFTPSVTPVAQFGSSLSATPSESTPQRPRMRARGLTDIGPSQKAGFFVEERPILRKLSQKPNVTTVEATISPRVIVRQPSSSRLQSPPPCAPPTQSLPPPPHSPKPSSSPRKGLDASKSGSTSSAFSCTSSISLANDMFAIPFHVDRRGSQPSVFSQNTMEQALENIASPPSESKLSLSTPRTLKKALSHNSLRRNISPTRPKTPPELPTDKRKPRNHPRLPIPPIPLSLRPSSSHNSTAPSGTQSTSTDQKASSGRKRLFSSSSTRPSTSQGIPTNAAEDDTFSVFSLRSENDSHTTPYKPWSTTTQYPKPSSSFWEEGSTDITPSSPTRSNSEYTPQAILSRDALAELEASVDNSGSSMRSRGFSLLSVSTTVSDWDKESDIIPIGLSPPPATRPSLKQTVGRMSSNSISSRKSSMSAIRPATADSVLRGPAIKRDDTVTQELFHQPVNMPSVASQTTVRAPSPPAVVSLPPPPRPRLRSLGRAPSSTSTHTLNSLASTAVIPEATVPVPGVCPPPIRKPVRTPIRTRSTVERKMHRRSIMRKPSFLDIDDDDDDDDEVAEDWGDHVNREVRPGRSGVTADNRIDSGIDIGGGGSFLDLARESFDTTRTDL